LDAPRIQDPEIYAWCRRCWNQSRGPKYYCDGYDSEFVNLRSKAWWKAEVEHEYMRVFRYLNGPGTK
jgi:hypothetical protein